jgi:Domain of unknown function (DUF4430)
MHRKTLIVLLGAMTLAVAIAGSALAAGSSPAVHVQIKSLTKTLRTVVVHGQSGWITKGGTPKGKCSANSAAGALNAATHGKWSGKYYKSVGGVFITSILGVTPKGSDYWSLYVNGKSASVGACAVKLHAGEKLLFKVVK